MSIDRIISELMRTYVSLGDSVDLAGGPLCVGMALEAITIELKPRRAKRISAVGPTKWEIGEISVCSYESDEESKCESLKTHVRPQPYDGAGTNTPLPAI